MKSINVNLLMSGGSKLIDNYLCQTLAKGKHALRSLLKKMVIRSTMFLNSRAFDSSNW